MSALLGLHLHNSSQASSFPQGITGNAQSKHKSNDTSTQGFCLDFFLFLSFFHISLYNFIEILLPASTMFSDFLLELIKKLKEIPQKNP